MKLYNTINNSHNNRTTNGANNTKIRTLNGTRYVSQQFNDNNKEVKVGCDFKHKNRLKNRHSFTHTLNLAFGQTMCVFDDRCVYIDNVY